MSSRPLPQWHSPTQQLHGRISRRSNGFSHPFNSIPGIGISLGSFLLVGLMFYMTFLSPHSLLLLSSSEWSIPTNHALSSPTSDETPSSPSDAFSLEQIRDIVAPTRGFFSRDYSLYLGWNNMQYILDAALLQANLLNRTLPPVALSQPVIESSETCADYTVMVNRGDAVGLDTWRELPIEKQMAFRVPISIMIDLPRLRAYRPVITVSEYLRLHGQDPEAESSRGWWQRELYHSHPNVFESNKTKMPSLFVIENQWYEPSGSNRVDYIPQAMKERGNWESSFPSQSQESGGYWPFVEATEISERLTNALGDFPTVLDWDTAKHILETSELEPEIDLDNDKAVEDVLNANGWEVLYTFFSATKYELESTIIQPIKQVAPRSSIRGFKDDYYHVDSDVVVIEGETHVWRKPGAMRFTGDRARLEYAAMAIRAILQPQPILALGKVLAARMRQLNGGRLWMGAHIRRGDFIHVEWVTGKTPEAHMKRVKDGLEIGHSVLHHLGNLTTYDIENVEPNMEQMILPPPLRNDRFYVATDERDHDALRVFSEAGGVFLTELLEMEDRRAFGWPLMLTDVRALVEQSLLAHSAYFYGQKMSSFAGRVANLRAARGADRRTALLD